MSAVIIPVLFVTGIGIIAGIGLSLATVFFGVKTDEKQEKIRECLPGANCGSCGYSGCDGYAAAIASGEASPDKCTPGGKETAEKLSEILGVKITAKPKAAFIACGGDCEKAKPLYEYQGIKSCLSASLVLNGPKACVYGCIGFGDCIKACNFGAITMENGKPVVCEELCRGCGECQAVCPKSLIELVPQKAKAHVACKNKEKGPKVVKNCSVSCIGCGACERACRFGAIKVIDNVAVIDYDKCKNCKACVKACSREVIK